MKKLLIIIAFLCCNLYTFSQTKIAVLPFSNLDGSMDLNHLCYELQDSVVKSFIELDGNGKYYEIISADSVNNILKRLNVDANMPSFDSDKWSITSELKVDRIISGTFRITAKRYLINAYIYYPETQLSEPDFQAKDIFKKEEQVLDAAPIIVRQLSKAFISQID